MHKEKFAEFIQQTPKFGDPQSFAYAKDLVKLWQLIWQRDDLTEAWEYQDELNEKWAGKYPAVKEI